MDELLRHRDTNGVREFLVKWRGYPRSQATWEPKSELVRRCDDIVAAYERKIPPPRRPTPADAVPPPPPPAASPATPSAPDPNHTTSHLPTCAKFERGQWLYGRYVSTSRGAALRYYPSKNFSQEELDSFEPLRQAASAILYANPLVAAVFHAVVARADYGTFLESSLTRATHASKIWYASVDPTGRPHLFSFERDDSDPRRPQLDTVGGTRDATDATAASCARREVHEEIFLPALWEGPTNATLEADPGGQRVVELFQPSRFAVHHVSVWVVWLPWESVDVPSFKPDGQREARPDTASWRSADATWHNLAQFTFLMPLLLTLQQAIARGPADLI